MIRFTLLCEGVLEIGGGHYEGRHKQIIESQGKRGDWGFRSENTDGIRVI